MPDTLRVLYVDDEEGLLEIGRIFLEQTGSYSVDTVTSATEALARISSVQYDAVISDYQMPGMDGIAFLKKVRASGNRIPFILFTGRGREDVVIMALNEGADFYLQKGGEPASQFMELSHKIRQAVQQRRAETSIRNYERRESDILNFLPDATFAIDTNGVVIAWNLAMEAMTGVPAREMLGKGNYEYALPFYGTRRPILIDLILSPPGEIATRYSNIVIDGTVLVAETTIPDLRGESRTLWGKATQLYDIRGTVIGAIESIRDITERKKAGEQLRASEERYQQIDSSSRDAIYAYNREGRFTHANRALCELLGLASGEILGKTHEELGFPPEQCAAWAALHDEVYTTGATVVRETTTPIRGGPVMSFEVVLNPIHGTDGTVIGISGVTRDITDRKKAEEELVRKNEELQASYGQIAANEEELRHSLDELTLRESALRESGERYRSFIAVSNTGAWEYHGKTDFLWCSPEYFSMLGRDAGRFDMSGAANLKETWLDLLHPDDRERAGKHFAEYLGNGSVGMYENHFRVQHADGHWVWIWSRGRTLRDADGTLTDKTVGTHIDVTAGVLAEDDLKKSEEQYRNVVEDQTEFISRFLPDGTHVFVNEAYCRYFGFQRDEILGHPFRPEIPAGDRERLVQFFASLTPDHPVDSIEHRVVLPDDTVRWQRWTDRAIFDASGTVTEYQSVGQDITAKKEAELALQESEGRYRTVFGATGTATVLLENDGTIILANTEYEQLSGYTREEIEGKKKWTEFVVREDLDRMHAQHRLRREDRGAALKHYEFRFISRSGEIRNIYLTADVIPGTKRSVASLLDITDRKLAEESLARSEQQYRSVIENIQDIFYRSDQDGNLIMASPSGAALLGYDSLDEILGKSIAETIYFNPAERAAFLADLQKTGAVSNYETRLKKKDGTPLPVATTSHYYYDESGAVAGVEGILRDITELKEAENSLRESEERFRVLSEAAYEAIAIHEEGVLLNANDQYFKMFGYEPGEALGKQILSMTVAPEAMEFTKQQVATGALGPYESIGVRKDGTRFPIQIRARNVVYEGRHVRFAAIDDITSRKVAEEALRRSEEKYRLLTDNAQDTIWTTDLQFTMTYVNNAIFSLLGYTPQEFVGLRADVWTSPEGMRTIQEAAETLFADFHKGILSRQVLCVNQKKKDGPWLDVEISASLLLNNSGEPVGFQGRSNDITDRKRAEDALHESERSYRTLFNTVRQAIYILDGEGRFVDVNDGAEAMYGYRRDEFVGKTPEFLSAPGKNDLARVSEYLRSAYAGEPQEFEFWGLRKNGDVFPKDVRLYKGIYFGRDVVIAIGTDITGRKMAEEALRGSEEKYRSLFDQSTEGIHLHDLEGRILDVNEVACVQSGYSREELLGRSIFDAHPGKGITNWPKEKILQAWKEWAPGQRFTIEGEHQRKDGTIYPVEISIGKVRYGTTDHILAIVRDITERKMAEEALRTLAEGRHGTEDELLSVLVRQLALSQGVQYALIARIRPDDPGTAHTLAVWAVSDFGDNFRYSLDGTPCENVSVKGTCFYPRDIRQLFPRDQLLADMNAESYWGTPLHDKDGHTIGILAMLDVKPMVEHPQSLALLKSFAIRASLELQGMQAEETLRNKEEYYRTIIQTTKDGFWIIDAHTGRFLDVNETYCKMSGYSRAEVLDMGINDIDSIEDPAKTQERIRRILSNGSEIFETDHRRKDGSTFAAEISVTYFPAEGGKFICFCRDITERKRAEENIRQQTDAMEAAIDGLAILNADQNYTYVNNAHAAIYGYEHARELIGRSWRILYNSDELQRFEQEILPELGQKGHYRGEAIGKKKDGSTFPQEISLTALENGRLICVVRDITGRRLAEERLKESEERYRSLYVDNRDAIMLVSPERGFIAANPAAIQLFSFRNEQDYILCSPASLSPDYQPDGVLSTTKSREMMHLALEKGSNFFEWTHCKSDGTEFPAMVLLSRLENGGTQLLQATVRDISGQKRAEAALEESEEKFRSIAEQLPEVIALTDEAGIITYASPASVTLFGMSGGEMAGRHFTGFVDEASVPAAAATFRDAIQQGRKVVGLEFRMKRGDGSVFDGELFGERYESASGQGTLVTIRDITERRRAQHQLEENRRLLEVAINLAQMATWEYDVKSGMFTFNDRFYELYGTTAEREGGYLMPADVYARQFVHPEDAPLVGIEIQKVLQTHDPEFTSEVEHRIIRRDGETRTIVVRYAVKLDASGNVVMTHGANQDITELRRAEEAVRQANRQLKLLTGITRHDINNQLLVLNSYLALSKKTLGDVDKTREYILREERVAKTIERQILFTKEYEGLGTSTPVWQNVRSCIEPALKGLDLTGIDLDVTGLENIEILADTLIPRVFFNLADNALRHGGEAMTGIRISSRESGTGLVIVFEDDGEGVVAEEKEKIFERGFGKNTGYGLFLTREILGITGITITETGEPGTGARFEMTVPEGMWRRNEMAEDGKVNNP